jgi:hypothetical protein
VAMPGIPISEFAASPSQNEQVTPPSIATDYYAAHLFLLPDRPEPDEVTPFYFACVDLCGLAPCMPPVLDTRPSLHGYTRHIHHYNHTAPRLHGFSYFLITSHARNIEWVHAETFGQYFVKVVHLAPRVAHYPVGTPS